MGSDKFELSGTAAAGSPQETGAQPAQAYVYPEAGSTQASPQPSSANPRPAPQAPDRPQAYSAPTPTVMASTTRVKTRTIGRVRSFAWGLFGGLLGAAALAAALYLGGVLVPAGSVQPADSTMVAQEPAQASQPPSITVSGGDTTVARAVAAKALPSVVSVHCTVSDGEVTGSGVILDSSGNIITNNHVVEDAQTISVAIEGQSYEATLVGSDASSDIAVLHATLDGAQVTPIEVGDSSALSVGDWIMTVGSPFGLDSSVSSGIVSSLYRNELMISDMGNTIYANLIQVDAAINPGNSGGALVNEHGQLVGICTLFSSDTESFAGIGFAIPGNYAVEIAEKIINGEQVTHAYIGLSMMTVNKQNAEANGLSIDYGAYVAEVIEGGPAEAGGIQEGDIVIGLGDERIESADDLLLAVRSHRIGETVTVTFMRGDERMTVDIVLGSDEKLQELQRQQREQQQREREQQDDFWDNGGSDDGFDGGESDENPIERWLNELIGERDSQNEGQTPGQILAPDQNPRR